MGRYVLGMLPNDQAAVAMNDQDNIRDKLAKLEALFARGATTGERAAAEAALGRMQAKLDSTERKTADPEVELQYILPDVWAVRVKVHASGLACAA